MKRNYIIILLAGVLLSSCDKFLDVVPKGKVIPVKTVDFDGMMADPALSGKAFPLVDVSGDNVILPEANINSAVNSASGKAYFWLDSFYKDVEDDSGWNGLYNGIYTCNVVLKYTPDSKEGTDADKKRVIAEAKVNRAYFYWTLHNTYAKAYNKATAAMDLSVPLLLDPDLEAKVVRSTSDKVVAQIFKDLEGVAMDLPVNGSTKYRTKRASAYAMLARAYFYVGEYEKAAVEAQKALDINSTLVDYRKFSFVNAAKPYSGVVNRPQPIDSPEVLLYRSNGFGSMISSFALSQELEDIYKKYPSDLRYKFNFTLIQRNGTPFTDGQRRYLFDLDYNIGVPEMMLIVAENYARKGDGKALEVLNNLRKFRFADADYTPLTGSGKDELLRMVIEERQRELPSNGLRWFDMKRLGEEGLYTKTLSRTFQGAERKLEPKSNKYVFPLAPKLLSINPGLEQNPR